MAAKFRTNFL